MFDIVIDLKPFYYFLQRHLLFLSCEFHKNRKKEQITDVYINCRKKQEQIASMRIKVLGGGTLPHFAPLVVRRCFHQWQKLYNIANQYYQFFSVNWHIFELNKNLL